MIDKRDWYYAKDLVGVIYVLNGDYKSHFTMIKNTLDSPNELPFFQRLVNDFEGNMFVDQKYQVLCEVLSEKKYPELYL